MDFTAFPLRIGTVTEAEVTGPALRLVVDLGGGDLRTTTARITERYDAENVLGRQVVVVLDPPRGGPNEVVVLAAVSPEHGAVLLRPDTPVADGTAVV